MHKGNIDLLFGRRITKWLAISLHGLLFFITFHLTKTKPSKVFCPTSTVPTHFSIFSLFRSFARISISIGFLSIFHNLKMNIRKNSTKDCNGNLLRRFWQLVHVRKRKFTTFPTYFTLSTVPTLWGRESVQL